MRIEEENYLKLVLEKAAKKYAETVQKLGDNAKDMDEHETISGKTIQNLTSMVMKCSIIKWH